MEKVYIDTSVFYAAVTKDEFFEKAKKILTEIGLERAEGYTSSFTLTEFLFAIQKLRPTKEEMRKSLDAIFKYPNISILSFGDKTLYEAIEWMGRGVEIGDAIHIGAMKEFGIEKIASFDRGFDKIKEIKRIG